MDNKIFLVFALFIVFSSVAFARPCGSMSFISSSDTPDPVTVGQNITFTGEVTGDDSGNGGCGGARFSVCSTSATTAGVCDAITYCTKPETYYNDPSVESCDYTATTAGTLNWYINWYYYSDYGMQSVYTSGDTTVEAGDEPEAGDNESFAVDVLLGNALPVLSDIYIDGDAGTPIVSPTESGYTNINVTFTIDDLNGVVDLNDSVGYASVVDGSMNTSCTPTDLNLTSVSYECTLTLAYNVLGGLKNVTIYTEDSMAVNVSSSTHQLNYQTIYTIGVDRSSLSWTGIVAGVNDTSSGKVTLNNTGNGICDINMTGTHIYGNSVPSKYINAASVTVDDDATASEGAETGMAETAMSLTSQDYSPVTGIVVDGDFDVWFFLDMPTGLGFQTFATVSPWEITAMQHV